MSRLTARIQARRLRMRCTIARAAVTGTDTYGADTLADPTPVLADLPCWYRAASGGGEQFTPPRDVVIDPATVLVPPDTAVRSGDQVQDITLTERDGTVRTVTAGPLTVLAVHWWEHYLRLDVREVA